MTHTCRGFQLLIKFFLLNRNSSTSIYKAHAPQISEQFFNRTTFFTSLINHTFSMFPSYFVFPGFYFFNVKKIASISSLCCCEYCTIKPVDKYLIGKALSDKNFVQLKLLFNEHYIYHEKENAVWAKS